MKLAWTLQVTAGVMVCSGAMAPSRASAERRGVKVPKWRGVSPTTIIAKTGFKFPSPRLNGILPAFWPHPDIILARFFLKRKPACQTRERSGTLSKSKQKMLTLHARYAVEHLQRHQAAILQYCL
jgi:hypothetical protein